MGPILDESGEVVQIVELSRDITDRKRAQEEQHKLAQSIEQSPASVVITDEEGTIEYVNPAFTTITGYSAEEAIGENPRVLKSGEHPEGLLRRAVAHDYRGRDLAGRVLQQEEER